MPKVVYPEILKIEPYKPGTSQLAGIEKPIKLSSNENPFGVSPKVVAAIQQAALQVNRYPDGTCTKLRQAIAKHYNLDSNRIVCGAGSDELIALLCQAYAGRGDEVISSQYGFLMYPISAIRVGATPVTAMEQNLTTDIDSILACVSDKTKIVFVANPNNPTGSYITKEEARRLRRGLPDNVLLVLDSAYAEYVTANDYSAGLNLVEETENTVVTRTFSKIYGLGGLRLGWAYCSDGIASVLNRVRGPFNVSKIAQEAGIAALEDINFITMSKEHNEKWREIVTQELTAFGLKVYPSVANFVLVEFPVGKASQVDKFLHNKGIIGRAMIAYGLPNCMRFTIGLAEENMALIKALKEPVEK